MTPLGTVILNLKDDAAWLARSLERKPRAEARRAGLPASDLTATTTAAPAPGPAEVPPGVAGIPPDARLVSRSKDNRRRRAV